MTLSSTSTLAEVESAYDDNADYDSGSGDVTKARLFQQACRFLLRRYPSSVKSQFSGVDRSPDVLMMAQKQVDDWLNVNDASRSSGSVTVFDMREARR